MLARLQGASTLFVNGDGFVGDVYRYGWPGVPVALRAGRNEIYVTGIRGAFQFELQEPSGALILDEYDGTRPDLLVGADQAGPLGVLIANATDHDVRPSIRMAGDDLFEAVQLDLGVLRPLEVKKVLVEQPIRAGMRVPSDVEMIVRTLLAEAPKAGQAVSRVALRIVGLDVARRVTFQSSIDGSAQFFGLLPPSQSDPGMKQEPSLVLSLHGAGVDALGQARSYSQRPDFWIAAPTNRRPFGFDWQDWGRQDAYEVRSEALEISGVDPHRVQLTGHSMGGHGTWHLAANDTDAFSAIAPSAGWCSFDTYGGRPVGALSETWHAADAASLTLDYVTGLAQVPAFVLHGTADNNVPLSEAEAMISALTAAGAPPSVHLQEGAGHWWDGPAAPGADCVDWPGVFDLFRAHPSRASLDELQGTDSVDWVSAGPSVDNRHQELGVEQVLVPGRGFRVAAHLESRGDRRVVRVVTENVRHLLVEPSPRWNGASLELDGQLIERGRPGPTGLAHFLRDESRNWIATSPVPVEQKTATRMGPFKRAFDRGFVFVVGTGGSAAEDAELLARARYEAQVWWYRGNGQVSLMTDREFLAVEQVAGNVILFGNAKSNTAWPDVVPSTCPLEVLPGQVRLGARSDTGDAIGALFVTPRRDHPEALVGVLGSTGVPGARLGYNLAVFVSGVGYPDYAVFDSTVLRAGDGGVLATGWWGNDWRLTEDD